MGSRRKRHKALDREREPVQDEIATLLGSLTRRLRRDFADCAGELGLALAEAQALWVLSVRESLTTSDLARALQIDPANASALGSRLERRGLAVRATDGEDRRRRLISLTQPGREAKRTLAERVGERRPTFSALSDEELVAFRDLLLRMDAGP
jgi:MarR family transcriptional regulator for hemolysin